MHIQQKYCLLTWYGLTIIECKIDQRVVQTLSNFVPSCVCVCDGKTFWWIEPVFASATEPIGLSIFVILFKQTEWYEKSFRRLHHLFTSMVGCLSVKNFPISTSIALPDILHVEGGGMREMHEGPCGGAREMGLYNPRIPVQRGDCGLELIAKPWPNCQTQLTEKESGNISEILTVKCQIPQVLRGTQQQW